MYSSVHYRRDGGILVRMTSGTSMCNTIEGRWDEPYQAQFSMMLKDIPPVNNLSLWRAMIEANMISSRAMSAVFYVRGHRFLDTPAMGHHHICPSCPIPRVAYKCMMNFRSSCAEITEKLCEHCNRGRISNSVNGWRITREEQAAAPPPEPPEPNIFGSAFEAYMAAARTARERNETRTSPDRNTPRPSARIAVPLQSDVHIGTLATEPSDTQYAMSSADMFGSIRAAHRAAQESETVTERQVPLSEMIELSSSLRPEVTSEMEVVSTTFDSTSWWTPIRGGTI